MKLDYSNYIFLSSLHNGNSSDSSTSLSSLQHQCSDSTILYIFLSTLPNCQKCDSITFFVIVAHLPTARFNYIFLSSLHIRQQQWFNYIQLSSSHWFIHFMKIMMHQSTKWTATTIRLSFFNLQALCLWHSEENMRRGKRDSIHIQAEFSLYILHIHKHSLHQSILIIHHTLQCTYIRTFKPVHSWRYMCVHMCSSDSNWQK